MDKIILDVEQVTIDNVYFMDVFSLVYPYWSEI